MTKAGPQATDQTGIDEIPPNPRGLKAAVTIMGILLVVGFFVIFVTIIYRVVSPDDGPQATAPRGVYGDVAVKLPKGSEIISTEFHGDRAMVRTRSSEGTEMLIVFDVRRGYEVGRFHLTQE